MQEMEFVRQARAGERPWRTRKEMLAALEDCQEEWTVKNMVVLAELFRKI